MIQIETQPTVDTKPENLNNQPEQEVSTFDTSVIRELESEHAILNLTGTFTGTRKDFDLVEFSFLSPVVLGREDLSAKKIKEIRLKVSETFYANGQKLSLAESIAAHAKKYGIKVTFDNFARWQDVGHVFH